LANNRPCEHAIQQRVTGRGSVQRRELPATEDVAQRRYQQRQVERWGEPMDPARRIKAYLNVGRLTAMEHPGGPQVNEEAAKCKEDEYGFATIPKDTRCVDDRFLPGSMRCRHPRTVAGP
jgi:hypothetical protein